MEHEQEEAEKLEKALEENSNKINKALKRCDKHIPKEGSTMLINENTVMEICEKCGIMYERRPLQEEINYWNFKLQESYDI